MTRISIAMATFNGAAYLAEQLDSLSRQDLLPHELVVCDDRSDDRTVAILEDYARRAPFPVRIEVNDRTLGYGDNFLKAANLATGDWVAFCDQDDVWLPNRLADAAEAIRNHDDAVLILQNAHLCNAELTAVGRRFPATIRPGRHGPGAQNAFWIWVGFLQTVKAELIRNLDTAARPETEYRDLKAQSHDRWVCMTANALGGIVVLDRPAALYRRHDTALTGAHRPRSASELIGTALSVGADRYDRLAAVAASAADYLDRVAGEGCRPDWRARLRASAEGFRRVARIQTHRAGLYRASGAGARLACLCRVALAGGYLGPAFVAMGWRSAAKDLLIALTGPRGR